VVTERERHISLVKGARAGQPDAIAGLYDLYGKTVYGVALRLSNSETDAEDVVQDVFIGLGRSLASFEGRGMQRPPAFSAKKLDGKRLYQLAREGVSVTARPVEVEIRELELLDLEGAEARIRVTVSSGTYIRSLAYDVGEKLGVGAHLSELRRTAVASFSVSEAVDMDTLETLGRRGAGASLLSPEDALRDLPRVEVGPDVARRLVNGQPPRWDELDSAWDVETAPPHMRVLGPSGELLAVCGPGERGIRSLVVWGQNAKTP